MVTPSFALEIPRGSAETPRGSAEIPRGSAETPGALLRPQGLYFTYQVSMMVLSQVIVS